MSSAAASTPAPAAADSAAAAAAPPAAPTPIEKQEKATTDAKADVDGTSADSHIDFKPVESNLIKSFTPSQREGYDVLSIRIKEALRAKEQENKRQKALIEKLTKAQEERERERSSDVFSRLAGVQKAINQQVYNNQDAFLSHLAKDPIGAASRLIQTCEASLSASRGGVRLPPPSAASAAPIPQASMSDYMADVRMAAGNLETAVKFDGDFNSTGGLADIANILAGGQ